MRGITFEEGGGMDFGIIYEMQRPSPDGVVDEKALIEETIEQAVLADKMGFDYVWFVEHHFLTTFSGSSAPEVMIGALSRLTEKIRLGFGVVVLPHEHPIRVAEKVAMADQLSGGRVDFGTGRSNPYEQQGFEIDPRDTRAMWDESLNIVPAIWQEKGEFQSEGKFWNIPPRRIHPKPLQTPHPPIWVAAMQPETYGIAAEKGIGVLAFSSEAPANYTEHIKQYRENIKKANPVGGAVNDKWANFTIGYCGEDNETAQKLGADAIKSFFAPDRPYTQGRKDVYKNLLEAWGGVPEYLQKEFDTQLIGRASDSDDDAARAIWEQLDPSTLAERGIVIAGDPDSCAAGVRVHEACGADQVLMVMQCDKIPHDKVMSSIDLFGREVIPQFR
jgi:alkanesulfonate monooxygenase SsuD/methylene tetrahydromethanopterin reductase-like flavin-dependent oxidoreductase (luciferase family)